MGFIHSTSYFGCFTIKQGIITFLFIDLALTFIGYFCDTIYGIIDTFLSIICTAIGIWGILVKNTNFILSCIIYLIANAITSTIYTIIKINEMEFFFILISLLIIIVSIYNCIAIVDYYRQIKKEKAINSIETVAEKDAAIEDGIFIESSNEN
ncbi:hypothetical protein BCR36DRAFT_583931, partial [Piromyces finnis]